MAFTLRAAYGCPKLIQSIWSTVSTASKRDALQCARRVSAREGAHQPSSRVQIPTDNKKGHPFGQPFILLAVVAVCSEPVSKRFPEKQENTGKSSISHSKFGIMLLSNRVESHQIYRLAGLRKIFRWIGVNSGEFLGSLNGERLLCNGCSHSTI